MQHKLTDYENPKSLASRIRTKRLGLLLNLIRIVHRAKGEVKILDVGGRKTYWNAISRAELERNQIRVFVLNLPSDIHGEDDSIFSHVEGDACNLPEYSDNSFDIVHSNSVIEHVGNWADIKRFAKESNRLAPFHFIQTPYFWFPIEPHFIKLFHHWLPKPWRISIWMKWNMGNRRKATSLDEAITRFEEEPYLLDQRMFQLLFRDSQILKERYFLFVKSLIAYRAPENSNSF